MAKESKRKGYVLKDTITNKESGEVLIYFIGVDDYVQENPKYCTPYKKRGCVLNRIKREARFLRNEVINDFEYLEGKKWHHLCEVVEVVEPLSKNEIIEIMREWYMPNYFDNDMCNYTEWSDIEVWNAYLEELDTFGEELIEEIEKRAK